MKSLDLTRIKAICFDVDGTLSDTDDQFVHKLTGWLKPLSALFPGKNPQPFARKVVMYTESPANILMGIPDRLGIDEEIAALGDWVYRRGLGKTAKPFLLIPGVQDMLDHFWERYPMSVVSARGQRTTQYFLEQFQLTHYFQSIVTGHTCRHTKPYPDPILFAAEKMNVHPSACLMVGDTTVDIKAGRASGAQTIGVLCGFGTADELRAAGADLILESTGQLTEILF